MEELEAKQRAAVVAEARTWDRTGYQHMGRVKIRRDLSDTVEDPRGKILDRGATDCAQYLYCVYSTVGLIPEIPITYYPKDWHLHQAAERYMNVVLEHAHETNEPQPGDVVLFQWGLAYAHGGIIVDPGWPHIMHAMRRIGVVGDRGDQGYVGGREHKFFTLW